MASETSSAWNTALWSFLLIACTTGLSLVALATEYRTDTQVFQQIAKFYNYDWFIVTAAVYRGFGRELCSNERTLSLNLPTPGRRQTVYIHLRVSTVLCF